MEAGLKRRVPRCPDTDPEAGKPTCEALFCSHPLLQLSFTFYLTSQSGTASERCTVVTGGDNPMDFLEDIMGNEVFTAWPTLLMSECEQEYRGQLVREYLLLIRGGMLCTLHEGSRTCNHPIPVSAPHSKS